MQLFNVNYQNTVTIFSWDREIEEIRIAWDLNPKDTGSSSNSVINQL